MGDQIGRKISTRARVDMWPMIINGFGMLNSFVCVLSHYLSPRVEILIILSYLGAMFTYFQINATYTADIFLGKTKQEMMEISENKSEKLISRTREYSKVPNRKGYGISGGRILGFSLPVV